MPLWGWMSGSTAIGEADGERNSRDPVGFREGMVFHPCVRKLKMPTFDGTEAND